MFSIEIYFFNNAFLLFTKAKKQQRKLNYLITQTELYAHFMSRKLTGEGDDEKNRILSRLEEPTLNRREVAVKGGVLVDVEGDDYGRVKSG